MARLLVFAGWTLFVWGTRVSNILSDGGGSLALAVALGLVVLGIAVGAQAFLRRPDGLLARAVPALVVATLAVWAVRLPGVLLRDHSGAFKAVHLLLAVVSVAVALSALRAPQRVSA